MMLLGQHQRVRTTMTLDDDVAAKLKAEARRSGRSFRETVNEMLRRGLSIRHSRFSKEPFRVVTRDLGTLLPGLTIDNVADVLEQVEGPLYR